MSDLTRRATRGAAFHLLAQLAVMGCSYLVAVILARGLGPASYGVYGIVYSLLLTVELVGRLGIPQAVSKLVAERSAPDPGLEATGVSLALIVYLVLFAAFWSAAPLLALLFHVPDGAWLFRLAALDIPIYGLYFMVVHILNGRRSFATESIANGLYGLVKAVGILALLALGPAIEGALVVNVIGSLVALAFVLTMVGTAPFRPTLVAARPILRLAVPTALIGLGSQLLLALDLWLLNMAGPAVDAGEKGLYVAASNIARMPNVLAFAMTAVLVPSIARALADGDRPLAARSLEGAMRFLVVILLPGCALVAANAPEVMALLFSRAYAAGAPLLVVLIFAQGAGFTFLMILTNVLMASGLAMRAAVIALGTVPVAILANLVLIPWLQAEGAAIASLLALGSGAVLAAIQVRARIGALIQPMTLLKALLATAIVTLLARLIPSSGLGVLLELAGLGLVTLLLLPLLGLVSRADLAPLLPARRADSVS